MQATRRQLLAGCTAAMGVLGLAACGNGWSAMGANTVASGKLTVGTAAATTAASSPVEATSKAAVRTAGTVDLWLLGDEVWFKHAVDAYIKRQDKLKVQWEPMNDLSVQTGLVAAENATATVLGWLAADKQMVDWCPQIGWLPARTALLKGPAFQTADWKPFVNARQTLPLYPEIQATPDAVAIETAMKTAATKVLALKSSAKELLDDAQATLVAPLKAQG